MCNVKQRKIGNAKNTRLNILVSPPALTAAGAGAGATPDDHFYVIEEGLNGRTTNVDFPIPPDRNGKNYLAPCLYTHSPLDLVITMLGGNDLKNIFHRTAEDIVTGAAELIQIIQSTKYGHDMQSPPEILLIGYPAFCNAVD